MARKWPLHSLFVPVGVDPTAVETVMACLPEGFPMETDGPGIAVIGHDPTLDRLLSLPQPLRGFIEADAATTPDFGTIVADSLTPDTGQHLFVVSGAFVMAQPIASWITRVMSQHIASPDTPWSDMETCIHEALANAVTHGLLELPPIDRVGFAEHDRLRLERLAQPIYAQRLVWVVCNHQSGGFQIGVHHRPRHRDPPPRMVQPTAVQATGGYSGRGVALIRALSDALSISRDFGSIRMDFRAGRQ